LSLSSGRKRRLPSVRALRARGAGHLPRPRPGGTAPGRVRRPVV